MVEYLGYSRGVGSNDMSNALWRRHFFARHHRWSLHKEEKQQMALLPSLAPGTDCNVAARDFEPNRSTRKLFTPYLG